MLYQRILTAIPLAIGIIWIILFQPTSVFFWLTFVIAAIAGYEWAKLGGLSRLPGIAYLLVVCAIPWLMTEYAKDFIQIYVSAAVLWWLVVTIVMFSYQPKAPTSKLSPFKLFAGMLVIPAAVLAMNAIHAGINQGPEWLLYGLMLVWVADIGAYFAGRALGKNKLAPLISPGKTREGVYGAMFAVGLYSVVAGFYFGLDVTSILLLLLLAMVLTVISVVGDLFESILKRERGVKDSGRILPGHGGILDRIDSVLAAMPVFMLGREYLLPSLSVL
jgi:phosphatidate cytidylyltransferase